MVEIILSVAVLALAVAMMAIGAIMGRSPIKGSCGGMSALGLKGSCDICGGDTSRCESNSSAQGKVDASELAYDADRQRAGNKN